MSVEARGGAPRYGQIILFGDSITEWASNSVAGFALQPALQSIYLRRLDVINRGFSGYNTANALHVLPQFMPPPDHASVRMLIVFFGANDSCLPDGPTDQYIPLEQYQQNLRSIVQHAQVQAHKPAIVLVTPPPVDEVRLAECGFGGSRTADNTARYARAAREMAEAIDGVACCDLWSIFMKEATGGGNPDPGAPSSFLPGDSRAPPNEMLRSLLHDGLHFHPKAYRLMFDALEDTIAANFYPDLDAAKMKPVFPYWGEAPKV